MIIYPSILGLSLIGIYILARGYFRETKLIPEIELKLRLKANQSLRSKTWENLIFPTFLKLRNNFLPALLKSSEYVVNLARSFVLKLEVRLKHTADTIHGKAINLDISQRSEYWENLNGNKNGDKEKAEK
ncbi:hypothetical protein A3H65_03875 [Candidatus Giovannonibacteria bacterium RIFCSPLOWO2_02_FULL_45_14]|uniref:Uncharacterized protein n=1 Tax=Candidatus Giovannonibacteria bacterium RIFCSPLOWO2_12_FULL_44_15 TaxID=1798364 RepID=A0A1F5Y0I3_9BACT|nr:MAG: hypothetical protein A3C75_00530 [Candidatus Giovannonibacteria bacterium RIFCSPHIGHO2_02_FULL_44_31]OGF76298.1 MAG: hypothetical protein A3E62_03375 [Candidatus Giovannonibacteria bacterium RIFCSPHIGHO2_12_FULL_44_29]OGF91325.1 MAG: hypothetical protein A3H65_03875 [Candidatus Giovannonibacteria bacterium RIFCSPLOWO2_02_FULL_45_14]OGF93675.1 MAG: hypothetical protein A3G54_00885 [Candidatus Giovannonibacteria bacterium RIFCSPLOWO2_12_FULL_44_15]